MSSFARLCRFAVLFVFAVSTALAVAHAQQTLRVPQDFPSIQLAISAAQTGDTVSVGPGTYFENLTLDTKEIALISTDGAAKTILDGSHLGPVLKITNTPSLKSSLNGFTIQNGSPLGSNAGSLSVGPAGVLIANAGAQIINSTFQKNTGISIGVINGSLSLAASSISTASTSGGCALSPGASAFNPSTGVYLSGTSTVLTGNGSPAPSVITGNTLFGDGTRCSGLGVQAVNLGQALTLQSNTIRNNSLGVAAQAPQLLLLQNLIYDNVTGGLSLNAPSNPPNIEPLTTFVVNNTIVNNLTSPDPTVTSSTDIFLDGTVSRTGFVNNILVGTTPHPVLTCATATPSINITPLVFDHNDLYNTTNTPNSTLIGDCLTAIGGSPNSAPGNLSVDPHLAGSTDLHPLAGSPVIDAGNNSAPGLLFDAFSLASGIVTSNAALLTDFSGNRRIADSTNLGYPVVDMGAYEASGTLLLTPTATIFFSGTYTNYLLALSGYTITATGAHSPGTITFLDNGMPYGPQILGADGVAHGEMGIPPGVFDFEATYIAANSSYAPSTSIVVYGDTDYSPTSAKATTTLTLAASPASQVLNQPVTLTVHLGSTTTANGITTAGPVPPGVLTLSEGNTILSSLQPDASGLVTYTIPHPTAGKHTYTVTYAGTSSFSSATVSAGVTITLPIATSLTANATPNPAPLNFPVLCSAHVVAASGPAPTGTVVFSDGATVDGTIRLTDSAEQGLVGLSLYDLSLGLHIITVTFQPDPGFGPSSGTCSVNVGGNATTTTLASSKNPAATTDTVTYTVSVANSASVQTSVAPAGSISLSEGNTLLATAPLTTSPSGSSVAALPVTLASPGSHILTASYLPATSASFTSSATITETIIDAPAITTVLSASPSPASIGQTITLSATVSSASAILSPATITFSDGALTLGTVLLPANGIATLPVSTLSLGMHPLSATLHSGTPDVVRSVSKVLNVQVNGLPATLTLAASPAPTALATSPVTLSAALVPAAPLTPGATLGGTVTFFDGSLPLGVATLSADGQASLITTTLTAGTHTLTASFSGNTVFSSTPATAITETITTNATTTQLLAPTQSVAFAAVTLSAHVASLSSTPIDTLVCTPGCTPVSVTFFADSATGRTALGTAAVSSAGVANLTIAPAAGSYALAASFSGSPLFAASSSGDTMLTVSPVTAALTLTANPNPVYQHGAVSLAASLGAPGIPASGLTGTITFLEGSTNLGTASLTAAESFAYSPSTVGPHTLTAVFSGNASLSGATASTTVTVLASDFVLSVKDTTLTIPATHHAPTTVSINATGALSDLIDLSCGNLPQFAHCGFSPVTHDLTMTNASTGTLVLDTDALLNYAASRSPAAPTSPRDAAATLTAVLALAMPPALLAGILRLRRRRGLPRSSRSRLPHLLAALMLSVAAITLSGCSGLYPPHVAPGTYTIHGHGTCAELRHRALHTAHARRDTVDPRDLSHRKQRRLPELERHLNRNRLTLFLLRCRSRRRHLCACLHHCPIHNGIQKLVRILTAFPLDHLARLLAGRICLRQRDASLLRAQGGKLLYHLEELVLIAAAQHPGLMHRARYQLLGRPAVRRRVR